MRIARYRDPIRRWLWSPWLLPVSLLVISLIIWQLAVMWLGIPIYLLPTPVEVGQAFVAPPNPGLILFDTYYTGLESVLGFLLGVVVGVFVAIMISYSRTAERTVYPYLVLSQVTPIVAIAPLLTIWLGFGILPKVAVAFLVAFFPIAVNFSIGLRSTERDMIQLMRSLAASEFKTFWKIRIPFAMPYLFSAFRISAPATVVGAIVGEFISSDKGLGFLIIVAKGSLDTPTLFLAIAASATLGLSMYAIFSVLERRLLSWHESQSRTMRVVA